MDDNENFLLKDKSIFLVLVFCFCFLALLHQVNYTAIPGSPFDNGFWTRGRPLFWVSELSPVDNNIAHISVNRYMCRSVLQTLPTKGHNCWSNHENAWNNIVLLLWGSVLESYTATIITILFPNYSMLESSLLLCF